MECKDPLVIWEIPRPSHSLAHARVSGQEHVKLILRWSIKIDRLVFRFDKKVKILRKQY